YGIPELLDGTGVRFVQGWARAIDPEQRTVTVTTDDGTRALDYDTLVYAIGSTTNLTGTPGVEDHAYSLNGPAAAPRFAPPLASLATRAPVAGCGNGLTGIEAATEVAESHPHLRVLLPGLGEPGSMMGPKARAYTHRAFDRLGIEVRSGVMVTKVVPDAVELDD